MRSRYCAYVFGNIDYIEKTNKSGHGDFDKKSAKEWSDNSEWIGLEIIKVEQGLVHDEVGIVEFIAKYRVKKKSESADGDDGEENEVISHHEIGEFSKKDERWYFAQGKMVGGTYVRSTPKIGRNSPCPCGSGKKFKKCCYK